MDDIVVMMAMTAACAVMVIMMMVVIVMVMFASCGFMTGSVNAGTRGGGGYGPWQFDASQRISHAIQSL